MGTASLISANPLGVLLHGPSVNLSLWLVQMLAVWLDQDPGRRRDATEQLASCVLWSHARTGGQRGCPTVRQGQPVCKGGPA